MVVLRGGGETYNLSSGRTVAPEDLPEWFKEAEQAQADEPKPAFTYCQDEKLAAQKCIESLGMWHADCVDLTERFHVCQGKALSNVRPELRRPGGGGGGGAAEA